MKITSYSLIIMLHFISSISCMNVPKYLQLSEDDILRMRLSAEHHSERLDSCMYTYVLQRQATNRDEDHNIVDMDSKDLMTTLCNAICTRDNVVVKEMIDSNPHFLNSYHQHDKNCKIFDAEYKRIYSRYQNNKMVPLHITVTAGNYDGTKLLLHEYKADPNVKTLYCSHDNATPLHLSQNQTITHLLLVFGAITDQKDHFGNTPLYMSLFNPYVYSDLHVAEILVKYGQANINHKTYDGETLLHEAIRNNKNMIQIVTFLLRHGADKELKSNLDQTPLKLALQLHFGYEELINLLR